MQAHQQHSHLYRCGWIRVTKSTQAPKHKYTCTYIPLHMHTRRAACAGWHTCTHCINMPNWQQLIVLDLCEITALLTELPDSSNSSVNEEPAASRTCRRGLDMHHQDFQVLKVRPVKLLSTFLANLMTEDFSKEQSKASPWDPILNMALPLSYSW